MNEGFSQEEQKSSSAVTIRISKLRIWQFTTIIFAILFLISTFTDVFEFGGSSADITGGTVAVREQPNAPAPPSRIDVSEDDDPVKGDANAPVTIIEFSDFECPFCGRFYSQTLPQLTSEYIDTGKVKLVYRDFPLSFHPNAQKAAEAGECADEQGKFWEMHDLIFENQQALSVSDLKGYAADLGLDTNKFNSCLDNGDMAAEIQADFRDGQAAGVSGTPSFFINGQKLVGAQPFVAFQQIIDAELA